MASIARNQQRTRRRPAARRGTTWGQRVRTFFACVTAIVLLGVIVGIGYVFLLVRNTAQALPNPGALTDYLPGGATEIYATDKDPSTGKNVLLGRVFTEYKEFAPITDIPDVLQDATIAIEDERFYSHTGVDPRGVVRALYRDVRGGHMNEGGSTLTQQLARNIFLNQKKTINRKIQEAILALQLERNLSKEQILEMYLNEVCYGSNTFGVRAAAKMYFGKPLKSLTLSEASLLAGLPQSPTGYEPFHHVDAAIRRRNDVLAKMLELHYINAAQFAAAKKEKVKVLAEEKRDHSEFKAPYFTNYILRQLIAKYHKDVVYGGGLKVYTTLNWQMQQEGERALANGVLASADDRVSDGALVSLEPHTGYIRAMVGGVNYKKNEFNNVTQGTRQPGSSFKVFVYTAAFMANPHRFSPSTYIDDSPVSFGTYSPKNYDGRFHGSVSIRQAITFSYNVPAVKVANMVGVRHVIDTAHMMGITSPLEPNLSLALGSYPVTPLELCSAYSVFPNHGSHAPPMGIIRVVDGAGKVLENNAPHVDQAVIPESVVADVSSMLADVVDHGTAAGAKDIHEIEDAHGKTGTTNDNKDAWFIGYTPELTTAVWVCGVKRVVKNGKIYPRYVTMTGVTGGHVCAPIWARFMKAAVPIQRQSGQPIDKAPEKSVPKVVAVATPGEPEKPARPSGNETPRAPDIAVTSPPLSHRTTDVLPSVSAAAAPDAASAPLVGGNFTGTPRESRAAAAAPALSAPAATAASSITLSAARLSAVVAAPTPRPIPVAEREVTIDICSDTGLRATRWCPEVVARTMPASQAPRGRCRKHRAQPGDG